MFFLKAGDQFNFTVWQKSSVHWNIDFLKRPLVTAVMYDDVFNDDMIRGMFSFYLESGGLTPTSWTGKTLTFTRSPSQTDSSESRQMVIFIISLFLAFSNFFYWVCLFHCQTNWQESNLKTRYPINQKKCTSRRFLKPGRISYSQRLTITGRCAMDLRKFPLDTQVDA